MNVSASALRNGTKNKNEDRAMMINSTEQSYLSRNCKLGAFNGSEVQL